MTKKKSSILIGFCMLIMLAESAYAEKMIILKGIRNLLDVKSATAYAQRLGYEPFVLNASGENYAGNPQAKGAIDAIRKDPTITAIYGFSGGGYNTRRIFNSLTKEEKARIKRIDILGAPGVTKDTFKGVPVVNIVRDSPKGHMDTPRWWLEQQK